jgi:hypothetical protein
MSLKTIRLELARDPDHPAGSARHGYEFTAPLDETGHLDAAEWRARRKLCAVRRFWQGEPDEHGRLVHGPGESWAFHYEDGPDADEDERGYRFNQHCFVVGEYASLRELDGELRTFRVVSVRPAAIPV